MPDRQGHDLLKRIPLFAELSLAELEAVARLTLYRHYREGMFVFLEGEPAEALYFVQSGRIRIFKSLPDGREHTLEILGHGEIMAGVSFLDGGPHPASAQALEDAALGVLRYEDLAALVRQVPDISLKMMKALARRLRRAQDRSAELALKNTHERIAAALLRLGEEQGVKTPAGYLLDFSITHQQLASLVGTTRETVTRVLRDFRRDGVIRVDKRGLTIASPERLQKWGQ